MFVVVVVVSFSSIFCKTNKKRWNRKFNPSRSMYFFRC